MTSKRETLSNHLEGSIQWWRTRAPGLSQIPALPPPWPWVKDFLLRTSVSYSVRWGGCEHSMSISRKYLINRQFLLEFLSFFFSWQFLISQRSPANSMDSLPLFLHTQNLKSPFHLLKSNHTPRGLWNTLPPQPPENHQHLNHPENSVKECRLLSPTSAHLK